MIVWVWYCERCGGSRGVVRTRGNPPRPSFETRDFRVRTWDRSHPLFERNTRVVNIAETTAPTVEGTCKRCRDIKEISVAALLEAYRKGSSNRVA